MSLDRSCRADLRFPEKVAKAGLTSLLSFAVVFEVVNGSFDNHTWTTSLTSAAAALIPISSVIFAGRF